MGWFDLFESKREESATIRQKDWEDMQADVRGLKRLAELEERERRAQNERFAAAIDELEKRVNDLGGAIGMASETQTQNTSALSGRINRLGARLSALEANAGMLEVEGVVG